MPSQIVKDCNTQVGKMKQMEELIHMARSLDFNKLRVRRNSLFKLEGVLCPKRTTL